MNDSVVQTYNRCKTCRGGVMEESQESTIKKAQKGDDDALALLLKTHYESVYRFLVKITLNPEYARDLTQDTMTKAIVGIQSYNRKKAKFSTWLFQIATNLFLDKKRKKKHEDQYVQMQKLQWSMKQEANDDWMDVQQVLAKLDEKKRIPLLLKHYYGYSYEEISQICQIRVGTAKSRVNSGLELVRKELSGNEPRE